jgi:hypothetical protein
VAIDNCPVVLLSPPLLSSLHTTHRAATYAGTDGSVGAIFYFVVVSVLGMYIVLSLFVSILLEQFAAQDPGGHDTDALAILVSTVCVGGRRWDYVCLIGSCVRVARGTPGVQELYNRSVSYVPCQAARLLPSHGVVSQEQADAAVRGVEQAMLEHEAARKAVLAASLARREQVARGVV